MSDTVIIVSGTALIIAYFWLTSVFRRRAEKHRITALKKAKILLKNEATPKLLKDFLIKPDYLGAKSISPWIIVLALPFIAVGAIFSGRDDQMLDAADGAGDDTSNAFAEYIDASARSSLLRSPLAFVIFCIELTVIFVTIVVVQLTTTGAKEGLRSVFAYLFLKIDDFNDRGLTLNIHNR